MSPIKLQKIDAFILKEYSNLEIDDYCYFIGEYAARQGFNHSEINQMACALSIALEKKFELEKINSYYTELTITHVAQTFVLKKICREFLPEDLLVGKFFSDYLKEQDRPLYMLLVDFVIDFMLLKLKEYTCKLIEEYLPKEINAIFESICCLFIRLGNYFCELYSDLESGLFWGKVNYHVVSILEVASVSFMSILALRQTCIEIAVDAQEERNALHQEQTVQPESDHQLQRDLLSSVSLTF